MPRPLKIKIFMDTNASAIEEQINAWLASQTSASIIKTEMVSTKVGQGLRTFLTKVAIRLYAPTHDFQSDENPRPPPSSRL